MISIRGLLSILVNLTAIFGLGITSFEVLSDTKIPTLTLEEAYLWQPNKTKAIVGHVDQGDIERGLWTIDQLLLAGKKLFTAQFTINDGFGRPGATGNPNPTRRPLGSGPLFIRTAGPDSNSCVSCHNRPSIGGAGDFVTNVFVGLAVRHPIFKSVDSKFSSERDTPEMHGSGAIELIAREMTRDLLSIRDDTIQRAGQLGQRLRAHLITKGVSFGHIIANPDGSTELHEIEGVDRDLVVRPWGQKGVVTSLRTFTINAANIHHGIQAMERFGFHLTGSEDFDRDGISTELTEGDITALVLFQASLNIPGQILPHNSKVQEMVMRGEKLFRYSKCTNCHIPELPLESPVFTEPGPFNLEGTLRDWEVSKVISIDLTKDIQAPRLNYDKNGRIWVRAFTDLKRHRISDRQRPHFGNEILVEGLTSTDEFITRRLWGVGNTAPYGHRGDLTTIREAILHHGGEAKASRLEFEHLSLIDQNALIAFLESLQVLPVGSPSIVLDPETNKLPYRFVHGK